MRSFTRGRWTLILRWPLSIAVDFFRFGVDVTVEWHWRFGREGWPHHWPHAVVDYWGCGPLELRRNNAVDPPR
jgi:hypothetical protein